MTIPPDLDCTLKYSSISCTTLDLCAVSYFRPHNPPCRRRIQTNPSKEPGHESTLPMLQEKNTNREQLQC
jgi:hypothetical protein